MEHAKAFTLVELLVVVTIVVVLLALLAPALDRAVEQALRAKCGATLHPWGISLPQYVLDHKGRLPASPNTPYPVPNFPYVREVPGQPWLALDTMNPYFQSTKDFVSTLWYCPANSNPFLKTYNDERAKNAVAADPVEDAQFRNHFFPEYAYFARVDLFEPGRASRPEDLCGRGLEPGKLLMADQLYRWAFNNGWSFNHSEIGPAYHGNSPPFLGPPPVTGTNQLFGDGSVAWKNASEFDREKLDNKSYDDGEGWVEPGGRAEGDVNFY